MSVRLKHKFLCPGLGIEPFNAPPAGSLRKTTDLGKRHAAFKDSDQPDSEDVQQAPITVLNEQVADMDAG